MKILRWICKIFLLTVLVSAIIGIGIVGGAILGFVDTTSDVNIADLSFSLTSYVYYIDPITGEEIEYEQLHDTENRVQVRINEVPQFVLDATVAIEDERFYQHIGFDLKSTLYAAYEYIVKRSTSRGASTITQQLVKNLTGEDKVTWERKVQEIVRAINLERKKSKEEILELYLNTIYLGNSCSGVGSAAKTYFGKTVGELSLAEACSIIGITQYPNRYDPYVNPDKNKEKQELILQKMLELGYIDQYTHDMAVAEELHFRPKERMRAMSMQSYFVDQVIEDVLRDLQKKLGISSIAANNLLFTSGLKIYCTMDPYVQNIMDEVYRNVDNFPSNESGEHTESAMVVVDVFTGDIKGIVGGVGQKTASRTLNRATASYRQPGSTIKPIAVYAPALEEGLITPFTVMDDKQLHYDIPGSGVWEPKNYYTGFYGPMTVQKAVEISSNPVPIQILDRMGITTSFNFLRDRMSITSLDDRDQSLAALALGGLTKGMSCLELTSAYASFANQGIYTAARSYTRVIDQSGKIILDNAPESHIALSEQTAYVMTDMLTRVCLYGTGVDANFSPNYQIAGKTGTTDEDKDRWFAGYTPYYAAATWIGFDTPQRMTFLDNVNPTIRIWSEIMGRIHEEKRMPGAAFTQPAGLAPIEYCMVSGLAPTELCRRDNKIATGIYVKGVNPLAQCNVHKLVNIDKETGMLATPYCPPSNVQQRVILSYDEAKMGFCTRHTSAPTSTPEAIESTEPPPPMDGTVNDEAVPPYELPTDDGESTQTEQSPAEESPAENPPPEDPPTQDVPVDDNAFDESESMENVEFN